MSRHARPAPRDPHDSCKTNELKLEGQLLPGRNSTSRAVHRVGVYFRIRQRSLPIQVRILKQSPQYVHAEVWYAQVLICSAFHRRHPLPQA